MNWENQWNKYIEYFNRGADELKISIRHISTSAILVSISKAPRSDALKSLHGGDALRAWPCTWRGTNSSKSGCRGVFRVLWDAPPRKCDGTCSTGMMGRMIGWVWWAGIAGKAWSACATTCYLCLVWMSRGVDPPNHTLNNLQYPRISIPHTHRCHRQHTQDCPGQGRGLEMFGTMGKKFKTE